MRLHNFITQFFHSDIITAGLERGAGGRAGRGVRVERESVKVDESQRNGV